MFIVLPDTPSKFETIIDAREVLCFNERAITFRSGQHIDSCKEWLKVMKEEFIRINKIIEKWEGQP